eukprot:6176150-Pleurochrysis_carterae.AAC.2
MELPPHQLEVGPEPQRARGRLCSKYVSSRLWARKAMRRVFATARYLRYSAPSEVLALVGATRGWVSWCRSTSRAHTTRLRSGPRSVSIVHYVDAFARKSRRAHCKRPVSGKFGRIQVASKRRKVEEGEGGRKRKKEKETNLSEKGKGKGTEDEKEERRESKNPAKKETAHKERRRGEREGMAGKGGVSEKERDGGD